MLIRNTKIIVVLLIVSLFFNYYLYKQVRMGTGWDKSNTYENISLFLDDLRGYISLTDDIIDNPGDILYAKLEVIQNNIRLARGLQTNLYTHKSKESTTSSLIALSTHIQRISSICYSNNQKIQRLSMSEKTALKEINTNLRTIVEKFDAIFANTRGARDLTEPYFSRHVLEIIKKNNDILERTNQWIS